MAGDEEERLIPKTDSYGSNVSRINCYGTIGMDMDMDVNRCKRKSRNPREGAGFFSIATFWWILPVLRTCKHSFKKLEDFFEPLKEDSSALLGDQLERLWHRELQKGKNQKHKPSLLRALILAHLKTTVSYGILVCLIEFVLRLGTPLCLIPFINYFEVNGVVSEEMFYASSAGLILGPFLMVFLINFYHLEAFHIGMKLRVAVCSLIYRKVLTLNRSSLNEISTGNIINLLANDAARFDYIISFAHDVWIGPFQIIMIFIFLWYYIGISCLVGLATIMCGIPIAGWFGKISSQLRFQVALKTDDRIHLMNEIIVGIQMIKLYVWEKPFEKLVAMVRRKEIKIIRKLSFIKSVLFSFPMFHTRIAIFLTILVYILLGNEITASKVFVITSFFNVLHLTITEYFTYGISQVSEFYISVKRIEKFLLHGSEGSSLNDVSTEQEDFGYEVPRGIILNNVSASWNKKHSNILSNISLKVKPGELTVVTGPVGCGKTSLFHAILKELIISSGSVIIKGTVSYASQEPWLFAESIKQNILFGETYSEERFRKVIKVCALEEDINSFIYKEETLVGERGVTLSGGQKARINLARAIYRDADVYLLDDPLSAVDVNVQKHLFSECITGFLKHKVVLLATHQLQYLNRNQQIVVLENGYINKMGSYEELLSSGVDFSVFMDEKTVCKEHQSAEGSSAFNSIIKEEEEEENNKRETAVLEELTNKNVNFNIFRSYFTAGNKWFLLLFLLVLSILAQSAATGGDYWVSYWLVLEEQALLRNETSIISFSDLLYNYPSRNLCIYILAIFIVMTIILTICRSALFFNICMKSSVILHDKIFKAISRSPMQFFNQNPSGRILNRFSKDMGNIDEILPSCMIDCLQILLAAVGVFVVVPSTNPWFLIPTAVVVVLFYLLRQFYVASACTIKRFEGIARSPMYTHLSASLKGLTTIHALKEERRLVKEFDRHQDTHSSTWFTFVAAVRAISLWLDVICAAYNGLITLTFMFFGSGFYSGNVGLAITQTSKLTSSLQWGIRQSTEVENQMTSVERVLEYSNLKPEEPLESPPNKKPNDSWPSKGKIVFNEVFLRYNSTSPWVLKDLAFAILPGQKVGIVGRTGAGKSSIISALFRLYEVKGSIEIDDLDTANIGLWDLRSKISVIPQDAVLFTGTFRYNLDPFDQHSDNDIWKALEDVEMKEYIKGLTIGLQTQVQEGGSNLSVGQRQLISLARAILHQNKILVLDEATANVDLKTDGLIQRTIRQKFKDCTVITIAHRLNSIMDSDMVMVMDNGNAMEVGHPFLLLKNNSGVFYSLVEQSGCFSELSSIATKKYQGILE